MSPARWDELRCGARDVVWACAGSVMVLLVTGHPKDAVAMLAVEAAAMLVWAWARKRHLESQRLERVLDALRQDRDAWVETLRGEMERWP